ncbi:hypothetical protein GCM10023080_098390 [Streptomyces pseudoechinosporeus]
MAYDSGRGEEEHRGSGGVQITAKVPAGAKAGVLPDVLAHVSAGVLPDVLAGGMPDVLAEVIALVLVPLPASFPEKVTVHSGNARAEAGP